MSLFIYARLKIKLFVFVFFACGNYKKCKTKVHTIPAGVAGAGSLLQSCYRVITAAAAVNYIGGSVSMM
jgi:hypothetical protein